MEDLTSEALNGDLNFSESSEEEDGWDHRATVYIKLSLRSRRRKRVGDREDLKREGDWGKSSLLFSPLSRFPPSLPFSAPATQGI